MMRASSFHARSMPSAVPALKNGLTGHAELTVANEHTAPHVGSGAVPVLATPVLVNLLEAAALDAAERYVPPGQQTVGVRLDIRHFAATPVGMHVRAQAEVIHLDGRMIVFRVWAQDDVELVADGTHERMVITLDKFDARMRAKSDKGQKSIKR
jgi:fluoroacetyl-CoA thioesterase